jgi:uncharacterized protein YuzE
MTRITYDAEANAAFIYLKREIGPGEVARTHMCDVQVDQGAIILSFDPAGVLIGIEILGAAKLLPPEVLNEAEHDPP